MMQFGSREIVEKAKNADNEKDFPKYSNVKCNVCKCVWLWV